MLEYVKDSFFGTVHTILNVFIGSMSEFRNAAVERASDFGEWEEKGSLRDTYMTAFRWKCRPFRSTTAFISLPLLSIKWGV